MVGFGRTKSGILKKKEEVVVVIADQQARTQRRLIQAIKYLGDAHAHIEELKMRAGAPYVEGLPMEIQLQRHIHNLDEGIKAFAEHRAISDAK